MGTRAKELGERPARIRALHAEFPDATEEMLARLYRERYDGRVTAAGVCVALHRMGIFKREARNNEIAARPARIAVLSRELPEPTVDKLRRAYEGRHGVRLSRRSLKSCLQELGIKLAESVQAPEPAELARRPGRLLELHEEHPDWRYDRLAQEYQERYSVSLSAATVGAALRSVVGNRYRRRPQD